MAHKKVAEKTLLKPKKTVKEKTKQAPKKTPQKQGWKLIGWIVLAITWVWASVIVSQFVVGYAMLGLLGRETFVKTVPMAIYSALSYVVAMFSIIYVSAKIMQMWRGRSARITSAKSHKKKEEKLDIDRTELGLRDLPTWIDIGLAPVGLIVSLILAAGLVAVFSVFPWFDAGQTQEIGFSIYETGVNRMIIFVTLVVIAPIAEEIIFRGWLYGKMRERTSKEMSNALSIVLSSLLVSVFFGVVHMQWNVGVNVFAMSLAMCGLREITGTIYAGILLHMMKNGLAFFLLFVMGWR